MYIYKLRIFFWKEEGKIGFKILPKFNSKIIGCGKNESWGDLG